MFRSIVRALVGVAVVAAIPVVSQAQVKLTCAKIGASIADQDCRVVSELIIPTVAAIDITDNGDPDFDIAALTAAQWVNIIDGTAERVLSAGGLFPVQVAANATGLNVNISGAVVAAGTGVRASTDYEYSFVPSGTGCAGAGTQIPAAAATATGILATAGVQNLELCLWAVLDGTVAASIVPDTYALTVTLSITAP